MASGEHQNIVKGMIASFEKDGLTIQCAALNGYDECSKYGRHEPDVVAKDSSGLAYIGEAETCDSLTAQDTKEQFEDFATRHMTKDGRDVPFYIGIPKGCENKLLEVLGELGLRKSNVKYITF